MKQRLDVSFPETPRYPREAVSVPMGRRKVTKPSASLMTGRRVNLFADTLAGVIVTESGAGHVVRTVAGGEAN